MLTRKFFQNRLVKSGPIRYFMRGQMRGQTWDRLTNQKEATMPRKAKELSALTVARIKTEGRYAVGGVDGLYLRVRGKSRSWTLRIVIDAKRCDIGIGSFPTVSLAEAREIARGHHQLVREGNNPIAERKAAKERAKLEAAKMKTFAECANAFVEAHRSGWKNEKHIKQWTTTLETYAFPVLGGLSVASIDTGLVMRVLEPMWHEKTETANRLRGRIESVLDWATVRGYRQGENPARWKGHLDKLLPARNKVQKTRHHAALPYNQLDTFMADLRQRKGIAVLALEFAILTAARSNETRGATWDEIDLQKKIWTIPASRMKAGKEHRVPLSAEATALLKTVPRIVGTDYVFPAPRGGQLSDMALTVVLRRMGYGHVTQHGFRSTFRDWAGETTSYPREVIEHALAHQLKDKAEAAYQRGDLLMKRSQLMSAWGKYCAKT